MARNPLTLLIDADILAYQEAAAGQRAYKWDEGAASVALDDFDAVLDKARGKVAGLVRRFKASDVILCFTDSEGNFRKRVLPTYKSKRTPKPEHFKGLRDALSAEYRTYLKPHLEGDDVLGILATHPTLVPGRKIVVSIDKDLRQIPGELFNPGRDALTVITPEAGEGWFYTQVLTGDATDGYTGLPGCGPKRAAELLDFVNTHEPEGFSYRTLWEIVVGEYVRKGFTEADALQQARVARILQHHDYDFDRKEPILWTPSA